MIRMLNEWMSVLINSVLWFRFRNDKVKTNPSYLVADKEKNDIEFEYRRDHMAWNLLTEDGDFFGSFTSLELFWLLLRAFRPWKTT